MELSRRCACSRCVGKVIVALNKFLAYIYCDGRPWETATEGAGKQEGEGNRKENERGGVG